MTGKKMNVKILLKSIFAIVMVAALLLGCIACSAESGKTDTETPTQTPTEHIDPYKDMTDDQYFQALLLNELKAVVDSFASAYGAYSKLGNAANGDFAGQAEITLQIGEMILDMLEASYTESMGEEIDFSFLSKIGLGLEIDSTSDLAQLQVALGLSNTQILTLCLLMSEDTLWAGTPDLSDTFLEFNMADMGVTLDPAQTEMITGMLKILPEEDKVSQILNHYLALALKEIDQVERKQETLELDGLKQDCTVLTAKVSEADVIDMAKVVLSTAKDDQDIKKIIDDFSGYYNDVVAAAGVGTNVDAYAEFTKAVNAALESLGKEEIDSENAVALVAYVDGSHNIIGNSVTIPGSTDEAITYYTVTEGNAFKTLFEVKEADLKITGTGTTIDGVIDGEYTVSVGATAYLDMELIDFNSTNEDALSGTIHLEPSAELLNMILGGENVLSLADVVLELKLDITNSDSIVEFNMLNNDALLAGVVLNIGEKTPAAIQKPANTVDAVDQMALMTWLSGLDVGAIIDNLRTAGVPDSLLVLLEAGI